MVLPQTIPMGPPNLKIIVNREFEIEQGIIAENRSTSNEKQNNLIGSEGAGLTSDKTIQVRTIWQDKDGIAFSEDLPVSRQPVRRNILYKKTVILKKLV